MGFPGSWRWALVLLACALGAAGSSGAEEGGVHVCVVGAGIAGASAAHFLSALSGVRVTVFERNSIAGGRISTLRLGDGSTIEAGASIIAERNRLMAHFVSELGLSRRDPGADEKTLGLWDGSSFRLRTSTVPGVTPARMLWRYGLSLARMQQLVRKLLDAFDGLYPETLSALAWKGYGSFGALFAPTKILSALTQRTFQDYVAGTLSDLFVEELGSAISRANYNADAAGMNALAGSISLAGSGGTLWAVAGGNAQVVQGLLTRSGASVVFDTKIVSVTKEEGGYTVEAMSGNRCQCDAVILATPLELAGINLPAPAAGLADVGRKFQQTVATFVSGGLSRATFGDSPPDAVLTTAGGEAQFSSVSNVHRFENGTSVFKVFSKNQLDQAVMNRIFEPGASVHKQYVWYAYPKFAPPERFAPFVLDPDGGLYYTSPIESGGSAMEMSGIAGANAAALVRDRFGLAPKTGGKPQKDEL